MVHHFNADIGNAVPQILRRWLQAWRHALRRPAGSIGGPDTQTPHIVSITHLSFDTRMPLFRQIDAYQRHRIKKLKQQSGRTY